VEVAVADLNGNARGDIVAGGTTGEHPPLALVDPYSGAVLRNVDLLGNVFNGIRVAAGDLNGDGRDEIVVTPGFGGDSRVHVFDSSLVETNSFPAYDWFGAGTNVALNTRIGFPIAADSRTVKLKAHRRARVIVGRFRDAGGGTTTMHAFIAWGDGTSSFGTVLVRGSGVYDVRGTKRYARAGRYTVTVTLTDKSDRRSIARSRAVVARR
jgi:FG-GAP repeat